MEKRKIKKYVAAIIGIGIISAFVPVVIRYATNFLLMQIQPEKDIETEDKKDTSEKMSVSIEGFDNSQVDPGKDDITETEKEIKSSRHDEAELYRKTVKPDISGSEDNLVEIFVGNREQQFLSATADYLFSLYGDSLTITGIDVIEKVKEDETELVCQIEISAEREGRTYSELFISSYNREWDFYSLYPYSIK